MTWLHRPCAGLLLVPFFLLDLLCATGCGRSSETAEGMDLQKERAVDSQTFYSTQSPATDPGGYAHFYEGTVADIEAITRIVQGVLIPLETVEQGSVSITARRTRRDINTTSVEQMLEYLARMEDRPVVYAREPSNRIVGLCTHYAMLTCSLLRHSGTPARVRHGFETYFSRGRHHDHTICEYWHAGQERWVRVDSEITDDFAHEHSLGFDRLDVPPEAFLTGADAWKRCRVGEENPSHFGIMGDSWLGGWDFVLNGLVIDIRDLSKTESLPWAGSEFTDRGFGRLSEEELDLLDRTADLILAGDSLHFEFRLLCAANRSLRR